MSNSPAESRLEQQPDYPPQSVIFPAQFKRLEDVRSFVARGAEACGLASSAVYAVQMAVDEAFTNIVEHAYGGECDKDIECTYQVTDEGLTIQLKDCGHPFNPLGVPDPDLEADLEDRQIGGLGLYFMRKLMDEVSFSFITKSGGKEICNVLTMVKRKEK